MIKKVGKFRYPNFKLTLQIIFGKGFTEHEIEEN